MRFKVPQFLDIEDKIFGPFTFSQFIYLAGGGAICFVLYKWLGLTIGFVPILLIGGFSAALVWYKINGKPFIYTVEAAIKYFFQTKLYIWKKADVQNRAQKIEMVRKTPTDDKNKVKLDSGKLRDLAWSLDVLDLKK